MKINKESLGELITTINNTECVVEIYFDKKKNEVNELKCLNYNRYKVYNYSLAEYKENINQYNLVIPNVA